MKLSMTTALMAAILSATATGAPAVAGGEPRLQEVQSRPSFDCRRARTRVERLICADSYLGQLDRRMANAYAALQTRVHSSDLRSLRSNQRAWLADRNACVTAQCLVNAYESRIYELENY